MTRSRTLALLLAALALTLGLAACGGSTGSAGTTGEATGTDAESAPSDSGGTANGTSGQSAAEEPGPEESGAEVPTIVIENGEPVGGVEKLEYDAGEQIRFKVRGDEAEEIHLHGYDVMEEIPDGGGTVEFDLPADLEGIYEAELEGQGVQILELQVNP